MKKTIHKAADRGYADHGWLKANHSFSFASYHDPSKIHFGLLRVLNDDTIAPGMGFGLHPHDNMEIVTIPLSGGVKHRDDIGNEGVIQAGDVQIMSAGKGIMHSEHNASAIEFLNLFQIWVFPKQRDIEPRYDQKTFMAEEREGKFQLLVSPEKNGDSLWINQDAWFSMGRFKEGSQSNYTIHQPGNGVYLMLVHGQATIDGETLNKRDALGVSNIASFDIQFHKDSEMLLIEVPMN